MPVKFIAEVVKGLFGLSETTPDDSETETSITVERESGEGAAETSDTGESTTAEPDAVETDEDTAEDEESAGVEESTDETDDTPETEESADETDGTPETEESVGETDGTPEVKEDSTEGGETVEEVESAAPVDEVTGIGPTYSERLADAGIETVVELAGADAADVAEAAEVSESRAADWITQAEDL